MEPPPDRNLVNVDDLDLSKASFKNGLFKSLMARRARLPPADEFRGLEVRDDENAIVRDGAIVPTSTWLQELHISIRRENYEHVSESLLECGGKARAFKVCRSFARYYLEPVSPGNSLL